MTLLESIETRTTETNIVLGKGGGIVKCAQQQYPDREVAIKKSFDLHTHQRMLLQEAQIAQLEHPSIVPIHQIKQDDSGNIEIIMKRVHGMTLLALLDQVTQWSGVPLTSRTPSTLDSNLLRSGVCTQSRHCSPGHQA